LEFSWIFHCRLWLLEGNPLVLLRMNFPRKNKTDAPCRMGPPVERYREPLV
jgi:hypothetical protein